MSDLGEVSYLLGIGIYRDREKGGMTLSQKQYIKFLLQRFRMENAKGVLTPLEKKKSIVNSVPQDEVEEADMKNVPYSEAVGSLMYAMLGTRPDLAFPVSHLSQYLSNPSLIHRKSVKRVLRYLLKTNHYQLTYSSAGNFEAKGY